MDINQLKLQAKLERQRRAKEFTTRNNQYNFHVEPVSVNAQRGFLHDAIESVLGPYQQFQPIIQRHEDHLFLGIDKVPGTPDIRDIDENPLVGLIRNNHEQKTNNASNEPERSTVQTNNSQDNSRPDERDKTRRRKSNKASSDEAQTSSQSSKNSSVKNASSKPAMSLKMSNARGRKDDRKVENILQEMTIRTEIVTPVQDKNFEFKEPAAQKKSTTEQQSSSRKSREPTPQKRADPSPSQKKSVDKKNTAEVKQSPKIKAINEVKKSPKLKAGTAVDRSPKIKNIAINSAKTVPKPAIPSRHHKISTSASSSSGGSDSDSSGSSSSDSEGESDKTDTKKPSRSPENIVPVVEPLLNASAPVQPDLNSIAESGFNDMDIDKIASPSSDFPDSDNKLYANSKDVDMQDNAFLGGASENLLMEPEEQIEATESEPLKFLKETINSEKTLSPLSNSECLFHDLELFNPDEEIASLGDSINSITESLGTEPIPMHPLEDNLTEPIGMHPLEDNLQMNYPITDHHLDHVMNDDDQVFDHNDRLQPIAYPSPSPPSLDYPPNNALTNLPKKSVGGLYRKDSKSGKQDSKEKSSKQVEERNKSSNKSNETKDKSKSKSTRIGGKDTERTSNLDSSLYDGEREGGGNVIINSGSMGQPFKTKAQMKANLAPEINSKSEDKRSSKTSAFTKVETSQPSSYIKTDAAQSLQPTSYTKSDFVQDSFQPPLEEKKATLESPSESLTSSPKMYVQQEEASPFHQDEQVEEDSSRNIFATLNEDIHDSTSLDSFANELNEQSDENSLTAKSETPFNEIEKLSVINGIELKVKIPLNLVRLNKNIRTNQKDIGSLYKEADNKPVTDSLQPSTEEEEIDVIGISPVKPVTHKKIAPKNAVRSELSDKQPHEVNNVDLRDLVIRINLKQLHRVPKRKVGFDKHFEPDEKKLAIHQEDEKQPQNIDTTSLQVTAMIKDEPLELDEKPAINDTLNDKKLPDTKTIEPMATAADNSILSPSLRRKKARSKKTQETEKPNHVIHKEPPKQETPKPADAVAKAVTVPQAIVKTEEATPAPIEQPQSQPVQEIKIEKDIKKEEKSVATEEDNELVCHTCGHLRRSLETDAKAKAAYKKNSNKKNHNKYLMEGKKRKHIADGLKVEVQKAHGYIESALNFVRHLIELDALGRLRTHQGVNEYMQVCTESITLVDYVTTHFARRMQKANGSSDRRFLLLCLHLQSILYLSLYKNKKDSLGRYAKTLSDYFKTYKPMTHMPNTGQSRKMTDTPSPGGSVASIGSAGSSCGSGGNTLASSVVMTTIPADMHETMFKYHSYTKYLLHGHKLWDDASKIFAECQEFILSLSRKAGLLTMQSSLIHLVDYIICGLKLLEDSPPIIPSRSRKKSPPPVIPNMSPK